MASSDGNTRDLVTTQPGAGWDFALSRHPYHHIERPYGPHYCVYNRRQMACCFDDLDTEDGYWLLRQKAAVLNTGEFPLQFKGPDAERLMDKLFTKDMTELRPGRCAYGLACYEDGGLLVDGIVLRLEADLFWYAQADGDFYSWARAHASGMDVDISDPKVFVSQVQGPNSLKILEAACDHGMPDPFGYFAMTRVSLGGQQVVITRTGYTNELGWEYYTEPQHDAEALWQHLLNAGKSHGMRLSGLTCEAEPHIGGEVCIGGQPAGRVSAGAISPYLQSGIGIALMHSPGFGEGDAVTIRCIDGELHPGKLAALPLYDQQAEIPRGKKVDVPTRG